MTNLGCPAQNLTLGELGWNIPIQPWLIMSLVPGAVPQQEKLNEFDLSTLLLTQQLLEFSRTPQQKLLPKIGYPQSTAESSYSLLSSQLFHAIIGLYPPFFSSIWEVPRRFHTQAAATIHLVRCREACGSSSCNSCSPAGCSAVAKTSLLGHWL